MCSVDIIALEERQKKHSCTKVPAEAPAYFGNIKCRLINLDGSFYHFFAERREYVGMSQYWRPNCLEICTDYTVMDLRDHHLGHSHIRKEEVTVYKSRFLRSLCPFLLQGCPVVDLDIQELFSDDWCCCCRTDTFTGLIGSPPKFDQARCGI